MRGSIHVFDLSIVETMILILGLGRTSQMMLRALDVSAEVANLAREFA